MVMIMVMLAGHMGDDDVDADGRGVGRGAKGEAEIVTNDYLIRNIGYTLNA